ncbi:hypothetical protein C0Q70_11470 [Pomacea canaliculata]|uniref:G-protein coupled receptors family 1 profile domain-containing protein n=1 Tax=Pomacea canaliculata TaxID=400727 RepID=A0A2T7P624_POMCA|nr:hypothetical protein C0Q70_11470 [Pomacea canaliculata]
MYRALIKVRGVLEENIIGFNGFSKTSQFIMCVISCERCLCVFLPFKAQTYFKTSSMAAVIGVVGVLLLVGNNLVAAHKHTFTCVFDPLTNETDLASSYTSFYLDNKYFLDIIDVFVYTVVFTIVLLFVIIITSILTVNKLYQASSWRHLHGAVGSLNKTQQSKELSRLSKKEVATTKMLLASSLLFIVFFSPVVMLQLSLWWVNDLSSSGRYYNLLSVLWRIIIARQITTMLEASWYHVTTSVGPGDGTSVTLSSSGGSLSYVPEGCIVVRSDSNKPWENPYDLVNRKFITCVIACERCLCVFLPFKAQKYLKTSSMAAVIGVVGVFLVGGMNLIAGHKHTFTCVFDPLTNETDLASSYTSFYLDHKYVFDIMDVFVYTVVFTIVLQFVIIITSILTVIKLYQASSWRHLHGAVGSSHKPQQSQDSSRISKERSGDHQNVAGVVSLVHRLLLARGSAAVVAVLGEGAQQLRPLLQPLLRTVENRFHVTDGDRILALCHLLPHGVTVSHYVKGHSVMCEEVSAPSTHLQLLI